MHTRTALFGCHVPIELPGMGWVAGVELAGAAPGAALVGTPHTVPTQMLAGVLDAGGAGPRPVALDVA